MDLWFANDRYRSTHAHPHGEVLTNDVLKCFWSGWPLMAFSPYPMHER